MTQSLEKDLLLFMLPKAASDVKHEVADRIPHCLNRPASTHQDQEANMNKQTAWLNRQRWHKLMLVSLLVLCSPVVTMVNEGRVRAFYPELQDQRSRLALTISSSAVAGMGTPNSPVKFTVKLANNGRETIDGMLGWSINSTAISPTKIPDQAIQIDAGKTKEFTKTIMLPQAGFVEMVCKFQHSATVKAIQKTSRVGCNPNQLLTPLTQQKDFDEF